MVRRKSEGQKKPTTIEELKRRMGRLIDQRLETSKRQVESDEKISRLWKKYERMTRLYAERVGNAEELQLMGELEKELHAVLKERLDASKAQVDSDKQFKMLWETMVKGLSPQPEGYQYIM
jgi:predicted transcriptional regulator